MIGIKTIICVSLHKKLYTLDCASSMHDNLDLYDRT